MKQIWFINEHDSPPEFNTFRRRYDMAKYLLRSQKYSLHIICGAFIHGSKKEYTYGENKKQHLNIDGVGVNILRGVSYRSNLKRIFSMLLFSIRVFKFKFSKEEKPDIIYASSPHLFGALAAYFVSKREKSKFILEIRDLWPETWVQMGVIKRNGIIYRFFLFLEKFLYQKANKIIYLASNLEYFKNLGIDTRKIISISNGVDLEVFDKKSDLKIDLDEKKFNITYTGSISVGDNTNSLLELAKLIKEENIVINIVGKGKLKEKLIKKKEREKIENIIFYNPVNKLDVPEILRKSDILIIPTLDIGLYKYGISFNKLFEYWAAAKPILFYGSMSPDYIKVSGSGCSISGDNLEELKEACLKLYYMTPEERNILGENGRKYVEEHFDWKILAKKVEKVLDEVLEMKE